MSETTVGHDEQIIGKDVLKELQYKLSVHSDFVFFDSTGFGTVEVILSFGAGAPISLAAGSNPLNVGARVFALTKPEKRKSWIHSLKKRDREAAGAALVGEFRAETGPFVAEKAREYLFPISIDIPSELPKTASGGDPELVLEIDLVQEGKFWLSDIGHQKLVLPIQRGYHLSTKPGADSVDLRRARRTQFERIRREERYEAIIFSLLNKLKSDADRGDK